MSVTINPVIDHESYNVNGKEIYKDTNGNWIARQELTTQETMAFGNYRKAVIENTNFKKHTKAEFKTK